MRILAANSFYARRANHLAERHLNGVALFERAQQELQRELRVLQILDETDIPLFTPRLTSR